MERLRGARARYSADHDAVVKQKIPNISGITRTEGDGEFVFIYSHPQLHSSPVLEIQVVPQEFSSYPHGHFFLVFACSAEVPTPIAKILEDFVAISSGIRISEAIAILSQNITAVLQRQSTESSSEGDNDKFMTDMDDEDLDSSHDDNEEFDDFEVSAEIDDDVFGLGAPKVTNGPALTGRVVPETLKRTRSDFRTVRQAGFLVGKICGFDEPTENHIICISIRPNRLCLSAETRDAWNLAADDYIVLLIRYNRHYTTFEEVIEKAASSSNIDFRLRKCSSYKPTIYQAVKAFSKPSLEEQFSGSADQTHDPAGDGDGDLTLLGIGESIDAFMNSDFVPMLKLRYNRKLAWDDAKRELVALSRKSHMALSSSSTHPELTEAANTNTKDSNDTAKLPPFISNDHLTSTGEISLPLIAAQFAMRYLVRCTDYCMVCHQQVEGNFEALKPYVCGDSLCLFQYMSMGFGPSIDLEVLNQPNVVDLLISFCYAGLHRQRIREYPTGLNLQVPQIFPLNYSLPLPDGHQGPARREVVIEGAKIYDPVVGKFNWNASVFMLDSAADVGMVKEAAWFVVVLPDVRKNSSGSILHHGQVSRVSGNMVSITVATRHRLPIAGMLEETATTIMALADVKAYLVPYTQSLDDLAPDAKAFALTIILAATPSVSAMREHLQSSPNRRLDSWNHLTPSASKLIRWIVASNRSYIVQVDAMTEEDGGKAEVSIARQHERISGVDGWVQFRFAQGSPEKEVQFQEELEAVAGDHKTILGWHGSDIGNWHSIIRSGLDFQTILHGRAYGNGVYFARDFDVSLGYTARFSGANMPQLTSWPNSTLKVQQAISLSEIINKPSEFVNTQNMAWCYVVAQLHWIQCRYLFVKSEGASSEKSQEFSKKPAEEFQQDPQYIATGPQRKKLVIPKAAISSAKSSHPEQLPLSRVEAISNADADDVEDTGDIEFLFERGGDTATLREDSNEDLEIMSVLVADKTDFRPSTLNLASLPRLAPPQYATTHGQKTIGQEIKKLQKLQAKTPLHELGWFIDFDNITNMFHWIMELHSFDPSLPLAQDMKNQDVSSIVLEIRFGREFPMSPPFLRVVRPRFLPFANGGGGHVTAGGAMCMELLTNSGWSPANSLESVLLQIRMALCSLDPRPARLEGRKSGRKDYGIAEAYDAYIRAAHTHGWEIPKDLLEATTAMMEEAPKA